MFNIFCSGRYLLISSTISLLVLAISEDYATNKQQLHEGLIKLRYTMSLVPTYCDVAAQRVTTTEGGDCYKTVVW